ncbi:DUF1349 domain-containing protein [Nonomuraea jabiensis]|uniref:hypothetical protein n=1 Tax=Nonomuraea jabiensis TaxID=882448 RepID=UPI003697328C
MAAWLDRDRNALVTDVVIGGTSRGAQVTALKEGERPTTTPPTGVFNGPMFGGPAAGTMWLRMSYHFDAADGENEVRAATSRDGRRWVRNGVWTLPAKGPLRIGLISMNRSGALAEFDYVRTYRD